MPSGPTTNSCSAPLRFDKNAIREPSGETAGSPFLTGGEVETCGAKMSVKAKMISEMRIEDLGIQLLTFLHPRGKHTVLYLSGPPLHPRACVIRHNFDFWEGHDFSRA